MASSSSSTSSSPTPRQRRSRSSLSPSPNPSPMAHSEPQILEAIQELSTTAEGSHASNIQIKYAFKCAIGASITILMLGLVIGLTSEAPAYVKKDKRIEDLHVDAQAGGLHIWSIIGAVIAGPMADWLGRRMAVNLTAFVLLLGTFVLAVPIHDVHILIGRAFSYGGVGMALVIAPVYIGEFSPAKFRGFLTSFPELFINFGILIGYACNYLIPKFEIKIRRLFLGSLGGLLVVLLTTVGYLMPESPRWLVMRRRYEEARYVLTKIYSSGAEADRRLGEIIEAVPSTRQILCQELRSPASFVVHALVCSIIINIIHQACGVEMMLVYSSRVFNAVGVISANTSLFLTILLQLFKTFPTLITTFRLDFIGRRKWLLRSLLGIVLCLTVLGTCLTIIDQLHKKPEWAVYLCILSLILYAGSFAIGIGPIASVYSAEIFPLRLRAQGHAIGVIVNQCMSALLTSCFIPLYRAIGLGGVAFLFMLMSSIGCMFVYYIMPETKGRTLEETWLLFGQFLAWRSRSTETETAAGTIEMGSRRRRSRREEGETSWEEGEASHQGQFLAWSETAAGTIEMGEASWEEGEASHQGSRREEGEASHQE